MRKGATSSNNHSLAHDLASPNEFNIFFQSSLPQVTNNYEEFINNEYLNKLFLENNSEKFHFKLVNIEQVEKIIYKLSSNAMGPDEINLKLLLYLIPYLSEHITFIINKCLELGEMPEVWKQANVIPIAKNNNPMDLSHFRPISILPTLSKILEKIVSEQLTSFLEKNNIIPSTQSGFRQHHSTVSALLNITDDILRAFDEKKNMCLVLLDYSKAFDTISHSILAIKLQYFGLGQTAVDFFL